MFKTLLNFVGSLDKLIFDNALRFFVKTESFQTLIKTVQWIVWVYDFFWFLFLFYYCLFRSQIILDLNLRLLRCDFSAISAEVWRLSKLRDLLENIYSFNSNFLFFHSNTSNKQVQVSKDVLLCIIEHSAHLRLSKYFVNKNLFKTILKGFVTARHLLGKVIASL